MIDVTELEALPLFHRETITSDHLDVMGHMNIRWYMALYDEAGWEFFSSFGMDEEYCVKAQAGIFGLKHFIQYLAEVRVGEILGIRTRVLGRSTKRFHFMHFMINETTEVVASTLEGLTTYADMKSRRSAPISIEIAARLDAILAEHRRLDWEAPICGFIEP